MSSFAKGMLFIGSGLGLAMALEMALHDSVAWMREASFPLAGLIMAALDLGDRYRCKEQDGWLRFVHPSCGGSLKFMPVWVLGLFLAAAGAHGVCSTR